MAIYVKSNGQGGGLVTEPASDKGLLFNEDGTWSIKRAVQTDIGLATTQIGSVDSSGYLEIFQGINSETSENIHNNISMGYGSAQIAGLYIDNSQNSIHSRIGLNTGGGGDLSCEVETNSNATSTIGLYVNGPLSTNAGISFIDSTINPDSPSTRYYLHDFALKTDIPSGLDLTNYQGEWNLVSNRSSNEPNYSTTVTISSFGNSDYVLSQLPEEGKDLYKGLYISCKTLREDTYEKETFISSVLGTTGLYDIAKNTNTNEVDLLNANFNTGGTPSFILEHQRGLSFGDPMYYTRLEYGMLSVASGSYTYGIHLTCKDINKDTNESVYARFGVDTGTNHNGKAEIYFQQSNINNNERITLESILNRITALEQALAEKANTANPAFTGKVSINSQA